MSPESSEFLCGDWVWDPVLKELRHHQRKKKGWEDEPDGAERLNPVRAVTWHRWSQAPMPTSTGQAMRSQQSRIVAAYEGGGDLTIDEPERGCAEKLARTIAAAYGLEVSGAGAPTGRRGGNLPKRDEMGRLVTVVGKTQVVLDEVGGDIIVSEKRMLGKKRRSIRTSEIRWVELEYTVRGPIERFAVQAVVGVEGEKLPLAVYEGYEGWADPQEWREFTNELARSLGVEARIETS